MVTTTTPLPGDDEMAESNGKPTRATGLLVIEVRNSNPNGDPDRESDPRCRSHDQRGIITGVSFKRKVRDLIDNKEGDVWRQVANGHSRDEHDILEARRHKRGDIETLLKGNFAAFQKRFWDGRVFGNTFLEEGGADTIRTGVAHFALGISVAPVRIERLTMTKMAPAQKGKEGEEGPTRGMAPLGYRVVEHGVYCMPFFVNPTAACKTGCTSGDIALLLSLIRYAYPHTRSSIRPFVEVRHAWYGEHKGSLGSFSEFRFIEAMTPKRKGNPEEPSVDTVPLDEQYTVPHTLPDDLKDKVENFCDLCEHLPHWCKESGNGTSRP
jgi:Cas7 group CRISPR-associated protein Csh2